MIMQRETVLERPEVRDFNEVIVRGDLCSAELLIEQGEDESLSIEAEPQIMRRLDIAVRNRKLVIRLGGSWLERLVDKLTESLTGPNLMLRLQLRELDSLDVVCVGLVQAPSIETESLWINQGGAGQLVIDDLIAQNLIVDQSGAGMMKIAGRVEKQIVRSSGVGRYAAHRLSTQRTEARVTGSCLVQVHSRGSLDAVVTGIGRIEYAGNPRVRTRVTGTGSVVRI
jgi:hypothetical protein